MYIYIRMKEELDLRLNFSVIFAEIWKYFFYLDKFFIPNDNSIDIPNFNTKYTSMNIDSSYIHQYAQNKNDLQIGSGILIFEKELI